MFLGYRSHWVNMSVEGVGEHLPGGSVGHFHLVGKWWLFEYGLSPLLLLGYGGSTPEL